MSDSVEGDPDYDPFSQQGSTADATEETAHKGGSSAVSKEGMYHVQVDSVEFLKDDATPNIKVTMSVKHGTEESEINKKIYHRLYFGKLDTEEKEQKRFLSRVTFLYEFGVLTKEMAFGKDDLVLTRDMYDRLEGAQAIVKVSLEKGGEYLDKKTKEKKMGKDSYKIRFDSDVWNLHHEHVKDVPRDHELAAIVPQEQSASQLQADIDDI